MSSKERRIQARQRIKKHLKKRGEDLLEVTPELVMYWWHVLNNALFYGILIPPKKIHCRNFRDGTRGWITYGWCSSKSPDKVEIGIRRELEDRKQFMVVLVHEMVHQYELTTIGEMGHGETFYEWAPMIKRVLNLPLSEYVE